MSFSLVLSKITVNILSFSTPPSLDFIVQDTSYDIDKYLTIDELKCGRIYVVTKNYELDKVYCEILFCEYVLDEEYYDHNMLDIEVLKEILEYCNIYKQQCIEN